MHTTAEQYSSPKGIHLFISANQGKRSIAVHINNLVGAFKENIHSRSRKSEGSRKHKRTSIIASWEAIIHEVSLPYLIAESRVTEMKQFCLGIPKQVLRILPLGLLKRTTNLNTSSLNTQTTYRKHEPVND